MITQAMQALVDRLAAGGVRACTDERDLNPPAVLIRPPALSWQFGGCVSGDWTLLAAVPDTGTGPSLAALDELITATQAALGGEIVAGAPAALRTSDSGSPLPAYRLTFTADLVEGISR